MHHDSSSLMTRITNSARTGPPARRFHARAIAGGLTLALASLASAATGLAPAAAAASGPALGAYALGMTIEDCPGEADTRELGLEDPPIITCTYQEPEVVGVPGRRLDLAGRGGKLNAILFAKGPAGGKAATDALLAALERDWGPPTTVEDDGDLNWALAGGAEGSWIAQMGLLSLRSADAKDSTRRSTGLRAGSAASAGQRTGQPPAQASLSLDPASGLLSIGGYKLGDALTACPSEGARLERSWPKFPGARSCQLRVAGVGPLPAELIELVAIDNVIVRIRSHAETGQGGNYVRPDEAALSEVTKLLGKPTGTSDFGLALNWKGKDQSLKLQRPSGRLDMARAGFEQAGLPSFIAPNRSGGSGTGNAAGARGAANTIR